MQRLAGFEVGTGKAPPERFALRALLGVLAAGLVVILRMGVDHVAPGAGPYALIYPAVMLATLYGRRTAGIIAFVLSFAFAWFVVVPMAGPAGVGPSDSARLLVNALSCLIVMIFAEAFRRAVNSAARWRDQEIERRGMLMDELIHRTKNNFAVVASLLSMQKREEEHPDVRRVLDQAIGRVQSFASAYQQLMETERDDATLDMASYLGRLVDTVSPSLFPSNVRVSHRLAPLVLPNERGVAMGLIVNESLTNAAKYAFADGRQGAVAVELTGGDSDWTLSISDDGQGADAPARPQPTTTAERRGSGSRLMQGLARQAKGKLDIDDRSPGYRVTLRAA